VKIIYKKNNKKSVSDESATRKRRKIISIFLPGGGCRELFGVKDANDSSSSFPLGVKHFHE
jgi:hypothetical protein